MVLDLQEFAYHFHPKCSVNNIESTFVRTSSNIAFQEIVI